MDEELFQDMFDQAFRAEENKFIVILTDDYRATKGLIDDYAHRINNRRVLRDGRVKEFIKLGHSVTDLEKILEVKIKDMPNALRKIKSSFVQEENKEVTVVEHITYDPKETPIKMMKKMIDDAKLAIKDAFSQSSVMIDEEVDLGINTIDIFPWINKEFFASYKSKNIWNELFDIYTKYSAWSCLVLIEPLDFVVPEDMKNFSTVIQTQLPTKKQLMREVKVINEMYKDYLDNQDDPFSQEIAKQGSTPLVLTDNQMDVVCNNAMGLSTNKFKAVLNHLFDYCSFNNKNYDYFIKEVAKQKGKVMATSSTFEIMDSIPIDQVGGLDVLKKYITKQKHTYSDIAKKFGVDKFKGILLAGSPGTGKSLSAKAIASILEKPLFKMDLSSVFDKYVGGSESKIRMALNTLEGVAPVVVLIDEIDKMLSNSTSGDSNVTARVLGSILTFMQDTPKEITWVFTANRVENLPPELLRKGRIDEIFYVAMPNEEERKQIFQIHLSNKNQPYDKINFKKIIEESEGASGAEIEQVVQEATLNKFITNETSESVTPKKSKVKLSKDEKPEVDPEEGITTVTTADILFSLKSLKKQVDMFPEDYADMCSWGEQNGRRASSIKGEVVTHKKPRIKKLSKV